MSYSIGPGSLQSLETGYIRDFTCVIVTRGDYNGIEVLVKDTKYEGSEKFRFNVSYSDAS